MNGNLYLDEHDDAIWNNVNDLWKEFRPSFWNLRE